MTLKKKTCKSTKYLFLIFTYAIPDDEDIHEEDSLMLEENEEVERLIQIRGSNHTLMNHKHLSWDG